MARASHAPACAGSSRALLACGLERQMSSPAVLLPPSPSVDYTRAAAAPLPLQGAAMHQAVCPVPAADRSDADWYKDVACQPERRTHYCGLDRAPSLQPCSALCGARRGQGAADDCADAALEGFGESCGAAAGDADGCREDDGDIGAWCTARALRPRTVLCSAGDGAGLGARGSPAFRVGVRGSSGGRGVRGVRGGSGGASCAKGYSWTAAAAAAAAADGGTTSSETRVHGNCCGLKGPVGHDEDNDDDTASECDSSPYPVVPSAPPAPPHVWWWGGVSSGSGGSQDPRAPTSGVSHLDSSGQHSADGCALLHPAFAPATAAAAAAVAAAPRLWRQRSAPCNFNMCGGGFAGGGALSPTPHCCPPEWMSGAGSGATTPPQGWATSAPYPCGPWGAGSSCAHCAAVNAAAAAETAAATPAYGRWRHTYPLRSTMPYHAMPYAYRAGPPPQPPVPVPPSLPVSSDSIVTRCGSAELAVQAPMATRGACRQAWEAYGPPGPWRRLGGPHPALPYTGYPYGAPIPPYVYEYPMHAAAHPLPAPQVLWPSAVSS